MAFAHFRELSLAPLMSECCLICMGASSPYLPASADLIKMFALESNLFPFLHKMGGKKTPKSTLGEVFIIKLTDRGDVFWSGCLLLFRERKQQQEDEAERNENWRRFLFLFFFQERVLRGLHKQSLTASSELASRQKHHSQMWTARSQSVFITYAAVCKYRRNLLLLHDFYAAGEILENLLTLKFKLNQCWLRNVALGSQQLWINDSCTGLSAWYLLADFFSFFILLKSAIQVTPTRWMLKPWQIHLRV